MSASVRHIDLDCKVADHLSLPQLETIIPAQVIQEVLTACEAWEQREKKLNMQAMIYLIIALALYPHCIPAKSIVACWKDYRRHGASRRKCLRQGRCVSDANS